MTESLTSDLEKIFYKVEVLGYSFVKLDHGTQEIISYYLKHKKYESFFDCNEEEKDFLIKFMGNRIQ